MDINELELQWQKYSTKMEELMKKLPEMERLSTLCAELEAAKAIVDKAAELKSYEAERELNMGEIQKHRDAGNTGAAAFIENQMGYHIGLLRAAEKDLKALLEKSDYSSADEAKTFLASNAPLEKLKACVTEFTTEYAETLNKLSELDKLLDGDEP